MDLFAQLELPTGMDNRVNLPKSVSFRAKSVDVIRQAGHCFEHAKAFI
jgi:hypothetical protein